MHLSGAKKVLASPYSERLGLFIAARETLIDVTVILSVDAASAPPCALLATAIMLSARDAAYSIWRVRMISKE